MGSVNDEIQRALVPIYGDKSTNHLLRLFRIDHGLLEENLWQAFLQGIDFNGSLNDKMLYLFSNMESIFNAATGLYFSGTTDNYVSTPDHASISITGDLCCLVEMEAILGSGGLIGKYLVSSPERAYGMQYSSGTDKIGVYRAPNGGGTSAVYTSVSFSSVGIDVSSPLSIAFTAKGTVGKVFYKLPNSSWAQLGTNLVIPASCADTASPLYLGAMHPADVCAGIYKRGEVYSGVGDNSAPGLGTLVAEFDASAPVGPRYRDRTGKIWTINGSAWNWV